MILMFHQFEDQSILKMFLKFSQFQPYFLISTSPSADMVRLYVNVQFQVKPLSTGTSSSRTQKKISPKRLYEPPQGMYQVLRL